MRSTVLHAVSDVDKLRLSNPKQRNTEVWTSTVQVKESRSCPSIIFHGCKLRKYAVNSERNTFTMLLSRFQKEDAELLRALTSEVLSFIGEKKNDWFPKTKRPKNLAVIQRCFNDPLDEKTPQLIVSEATKWSATSKIEHMSGRLHDVHLVINAVRFQDKDISLEFKIAEMRPTDVRNVIRVRMNIPDDNENENENDNAKKCAIGPDSEDMAYANNVVRVNAIRESLHEALKLEDVALVDSDIARFVESTLIRR